MHIYTTIYIRGIESMTKTIVRIPKDSKHRIVVPNEVWEAEDLHEGDLLEVDFVKVRKAGG